MSKPRTPTRKAPKAPYPAHGGPGGGVDGRPEGYENEDIEPIDPEVFAEELEAELAIAFGTDLEHFLKSRLTTAISARMLATQAGHYNTAKNWEIIVHRLRKELDRFREEQRRERELAGASETVDPVALARRILVNLPALVAVAPDAAEQAWRVLGQKLGKA